KLTTGTYAHLQVEDLRAAVDALPKSLPFTTRLLRFEGGSPKATAAGLQKSLGNRGLQRVGETGFEPATPWSRIRFGALGWVGIECHWRASARHHWECRANRYIEWNRCRARPTGICPLCVPAVWGASRAAAKSARRGRRPSRLPGHGLQALRRRRA